MEQYLDVLLSREESNHELGNGNFGCNRNGALEVIKMDDLLCALSLIYDLFG